MQTLFALSALLVSTTAIKTLSSSTLALDSGCRKGGVRSKNESRYSCSACNNNILGQAWQGKFPFETATELASSTKALAAMGTDKQCTLDNTLIGNVADDNCCFNAEKFGSSVTSQIWDTSNDESKTCARKEQDRCYRVLCEASNAFGKNANACENICNDSSNDCYDQLCINLGRCDARKTGGLIDKTEKGSGIIGANVDANTNCASVMMTDDCTECGCNLDCGTPVAETGESACGYWCGKTLDRDQCSDEAAQNAVSTDAAGRNKHCFMPFRKGSEDCEAYEARGGEKMGITGGCTWDDSKIGVCLVTELALGNTLVKTISGCEAQDAGFYPCIEIYENGVLVSSTVNDVLVTACKPCTDGNCQASGANKGQDAAKCRAMINEPSQKTIQVRDVFMSGTDLGFLGGVIPATCPGYVKNADGEDSLGYTTTIESYTTRQERCQELSGSGARCTWVNYGQGMGCVSNPCSFHNSAGGCTIQNTGGRCLWFERGQRPGGDGRNQWISSKTGTWNPDIMVMNPYNRGYRGCYMSPCNTPVPNTAWKCSANGNNPGLAGCELSCQDLRQSLKRPTGDLYEGRPEFNNSKASAVSNQVFSDMYPSCDAQFGGRDSNAKLGGDKVFFGCPCLAYKKVRSFYGKKFIGTENEYYYGSKTNTGTFIRGPNSQACKDQKADTQDQATYCETYGPCANSIVQEADVYTPEFKCATKRTGKVPETCQDKKKKLQIQTHYQCRWGQGQTGVGCQNVKATSSSGGNNVRCDQGCVEMTDLMALGVEKKLLAKFGIGGRNSQGAQSTARVDPDQCMPNTACFACRPCDIVDFNSTTYQVKRVWNSASEDSACSFVNAGNHGQYGDCKQCTIASPCWGPLYGSGGGAFGGGL